MFKVQAFSTTQLSLLQLRHDDGRDDKDWGREEEPGPSSLNNGLARRGQNWEWEREI